MNTRFRHLTSEIHRRTIDSLVLHNIYQSYFSIHCKACLSFQYYIITHCSQITSSSVKQLTACYETADRLLSDGIRINYCILNTGTYNRRFEHGCIDQQQTTKAVMDPSYTLSYSFLSFLCTQKHLKFTTQDHNTHGPLARPYSTLGQT